MAFFATDTSAENDGRHEAHRGRGTGRGSTSNQEHFNNLSMPEIYALTIKFMRYTWGEYFSDDRKSLFLARS
jgi:hypothetical protein